MPFLSVAGAVGHMSHLAKRLDEVIGGIAIVFDDQQAHGPHPIGAGHESLTQGGVAHLIETGPPIEPQSAKKRGGRTNLPPLHPRSQRGRWMPGSVDSSSQQVGVRLILLLFGIGRSLPCRQLGAAQAPVPEFMGTGRSPPPTGPRRCGGRHDKRRAPLAFKHCRAGPRQSAFPDPTSRVSIPTSCRSIALRPPPCAHRPAKKPPCR